MSNPDFPLIPPWEDMNFAANCTAWGNWLATWLLPNPWNRLESVDGGFYQTLTLIQASFPPDLVKELASNMSMPRLAGVVNAWWTFEMYDAFDWDETATPTTLKVDSAFAQNVLLAGIEKCPEDACKAEGNTGNADITGIGIYIAYFMQAALTTLYLVAVTASHIGDYSKTRAGNRGRRSFPRENKPGATAQRPTLGRRALDAFRGSLDTFLVSAMLMSIAMTCAALYLAVKGYKKNSIPLANQELPFGDSSKYNQVLSVIAATFSSFPVLVLYALLSRRDRGSPDGGGATSHRTWLRRAALLVIWVLLATEVFLSPRGNSDYDSRHDKEQEANWDPCNKRGGTRYWQTMKAAQFLVIGLPLLWIVVSFFFTAGFGVRGLADRPWLRGFADRPLVRGVRGIWELGVAWLNLLVAWALLAYFSILREEIIETARGADKANEWTFGQVLTLATWVPVVLEWLYIFIWGIEDGLNTRLPEGFEVRPSQPRGNYTHVGAVSLGPHEQDGVELPLVKSSGFTEMAPAQKDTAG